MIRRSIVFASLELFSVGAIMADDDQPIESAEEVVDVFVTHSGTSHRFSLDADATLVDLSEVVSEQLSIPAKNQKYIIRPKPGLVKPPFNLHSSLPASDLAKRQFTLLGSTVAEWRGHRVEVENRWWVILESVQQP